MDDPRLASPAVARNRDAILAALQAALPPSGLLLEIASGTGEHAVHCAPALPSLAWQPTDRDPAARASIDAWTNGISSIRPALPLDSAAADWPVTAADAVLCINMVHIAPWAAAQGLIAGAARILPPGAPLMLYGPFLQDGVETAPGNVAFDADLRARDPAWGVRRLEDVAELAHQAGFTGPAITLMPANNLFVVFRRA